MRKSSQAPSRERVFERLAAQRRTRFVAEPAFHDEDKIRHFRDDNGTSTFVNHAAKKRFSSTLFCRDSIAFFKNNPNEAKGKGFPPVSFIGMICGVDMLAGKLFTSFLI